MKIDRTYLIAGGVGLLLILAGLGYWVWGRDSGSQTASGDCVPKETFEVAASDYALGKADAPVTIIEYASMTCIHCANFSREVYPLLKENYIDKGHVRYVFREFPLDPVALTVSVVGRCLPRDAYLPFVDLMYHDLETWVQQEDRRASIKEMARRAGMTGDAFEKCLLTEDDAKKIVAAQTQANKDYCINSTPTFLMNGKKLSTGGIPWNELDEKLRAEMKAKGVELPAAATDGAAPPVEGTAAPSDAATTPVAPPEGAAPAGAGTTPAPAAATPPPATTPAPAKPDTGTKPNP